MRRALATVAAALGIISCSQKQIERIIPVYNPPRELVQDLDTLKAYKEVWSDGETLKVSLYLELDDGTRIIDSTWERQEAKNSGKCISKKATLRAKTIYNGREGVLESTIADEGCDLVVLSCSGALAYSDGTSEDMTAFSCPPALQLANVFAYTEEGLSENAYDLKEQTRLWHERKGVKHVE